MEGQMDRGQTSDFTSEGQLKCPLHPQFRLAFSCLECGYSVCPQCASSAHRGHTITPLVSARDNIQRLRSELESRKVEIKQMKRSLDEMSKTIDETTSDQMISIEGERDRKRLAVECDSRSLTRHVTVVRDDLEKEEERIYALTYSSETVLSVEGQNDRYLRDKIESEIETLVSGSLPRIESFTKLQGEVERFKSSTTSSGRVHTIMTSSSATFSLLSMPMEGSVDGSSSTALDTGSSADDAQQASGVNDRTDRSLTLEHAVTGRQARPSTSEMQIETETVSDTGEVEDRQDEATMADAEEMDTGGAQICEGGSGEESTGGEGNGRQGEGADGGGGGEEGGVRQNISKSENDDDQLLYKLAKQILPDKLTHLGLNLGLSNVTIKQIVKNHPTDIIEAIYWMMQEWKQSLPVRILEDGHFRKLVDFLRQVEDVNAADWLSDQILEHAE